MPAALALLFAIGLATSTTPPPDPGATLSPLDVPGHANKVIMVKPDRSADKVICRNEVAPDSHLSKRVCARRRDRDAITAAHQQQITQHQHTCDIVGAC
jgi:hypothetical protein